MHRTILVLLLAALSLPAADAGLIYQGRKGAGHAKHVVFVTADQEYRSEESTPAFARLLAERQGFRCTVLLPINKQTGEIDAQTDDNIPGLEALRTADLMVLFLRFQELPDEQMKWIIDYTNSGRPILALRTATHSFNYKKRIDSPYAKYSFRSKDPDGGYGRLVLGETWINHYGAHQKESTRGVPAEGMAAHPILRGAEDIWGPSDVYAITTLSGDAKPLLMGRVLAGMEPSSPPNPDKKLTPVAWIKTYTGSSGRASRVFTTTMGHPGDFRSEGFRRMLVNACYWALGMEKKIPARANVDFVGDYNPTGIGFRKDKRGVRLSDLMPPAAR